MNDYLAVLLATIKSYQDQTIYLEEWMQLVRECPLRRIYTDDYYKLAKKMAATLTARAKRSCDAQEYLVVLTDIIKSYEDIYHPQQLLPDDQQLSKLLSYYRGPLGKPTRVRGVRISAITKVLAGTRKLTSVELEEISKLFTISAKAFQPRET